MFHKSQIYKILSPEFKLYLNRFEKSTLYFGKSTYYFGKLNGRYGKASKNIRIGYCPPKNNESEQFLCKARKSRINENNPAIKNQKRNLSGFQYRQPILKQIDPCTFTQDLVPGSRQIIYTFLTIGIIGKS